MNTKLVTSMCIVLTLLRASAAVLYVDLNSTSPTPPYTNWTTAATNIQNAVDAASVGDEVVVTNGIYANGSTMAAGDPTPNRLAVTKPVAVSSVNGPQFTVILGYQVPGTTLGAAAIRCVYLTNGASLAGFTLTNGATWNNGGGGGLLCASASAQVSNCVVIGNSAGLAGGGGVYQGTINNSTLTANSATSGGGASSPTVGAPGGSTCTLNNCTLSGNRATWGGGAYSAKLSKCTLSGNSANQGGGAFQGTLYECTLTANSATSGGGAYGSSCILSNCTLTGNSASGSGGGTYSCVLNNCTVISNTVPGQNSGSGGGACTGSLTNCTLTANSAAEGGGAASATLANCNLKGNASGSGGGARGCTLINCMISTNSAYFGGAPCGGGSWGGTLYKCTLSGNSAGFQGGGAYSSTLYNCLIVGNQAPGTNSYQFGGGAALSTLNNCTIVGNSAGNSQGGVAGGTINNCVVYFNTAPDSPNFAQGGTVLNYCCTTPFPTNGIGSIANDPLFVDLAGGNLRLQPNSPCVNSANNAYVRTATDLDGNPRIVAGTADIGAYEYQTPTSVISYAWLQYYGFPTDGSVDYADPDGDGMNNWQEWICGTNPTNSLSVLRMLTPSNSLSGIIVPWQSVSGITYYLQRSTNLDVEPPFLSVQSNLLGQTGATIYTDTTAVGSGPFYYRVGIQH